MSQAEKVTGAPKFAANISTLFKEFPFPERIGKAAAAGFKAVECLFPYDYSTAELARNLRHHSVQQVLLNMPPGDWDGGERGIAALPGREQEFKDSVELALRYAQALNCKKLHAMSGIVPLGADRAAMTQTWLANIRYAADRLAPFGISVMIESLNNRNMPGYFLVDQYETLALVRRTNRPNVRVQLDIFHAQIANGDLTTLIHAMGPMIGHVQIAAVPDRGEPDQGEVSYPHIYHALAQAGYHDWIGCEYTPRAGTEAGLGWLKTYPQTN